MSDDEDDGLDLYRAMVPTPSIPVAPVLQPVSSPHDRCYLCNGTGDLDIKTGKSRRRSAYLIRAHPACWDRVIGDQIK